MTTKPTPPEARPLSAREFWHVFPLPAEAHTDKQIMMAFAEAYAAHVSKPLADALQRCINARGYRGNIEARRQAEAALEKFRKGRK